MILRVSILPAAGASLAAARGSEPPRFRTSDRCIACHNGLITPSGRDVSIGFEWRASIMANSSRDPYWQASARRETIDHAAVRGQVEDECSVCHMPITRYLAKQRGKEGQIFAHLRAVYLMVTRTGREIGRAPRRRTMPTAVREARPRCGFSIWGRTSISR